MTNYPVAMIRGARFLAIGLAGCLAVSLYGAETPAGASRFYLTADPAISWTESASFTVGTGTGEFRFYPGPRLDVGLGYKLTSWLAFELEAGAAYNPVHTVEPDGSENNSLRLVQRFAMPNAVLQVPLGHRIHVFAGAGCGGVFTSIQRWFEPSDELSGSDIVFGYQGFAGCRYDFDSRIAVGAAYRLLQTDDHSFDHLGGLRTHSLSLSLSVKF